MDQHAFTFFVAGGSELAVRALANFDRLIRPRLGGGCTLTVVDILEEPRKAREHRVVATPMLVRERPAPTIKILGDLSQEAKVLAQLGLAESSSVPPRAASSPDSPRAESSSDSPRAEGSPDASCPSDEEECV